MQKLINIFRQPATSVAMHQYICACKMNEDNRYILSAFNVNYAGALCYADLPLGANDIKYEHHQSANYYVDEMLTMGRCHYEIDRVNEMGLIHSRGRKFKIT